MACIRIDSTQRKVKRWWLPVQSVTADFYSEEDRGKVFGTLHLTSAAGAAFGGLYATNMGESLGLNWYKGRMDSIRFLLWPPQ